MSAPAPAAAAIPLVERLRQAPQGGRRALARARIEELVTAAPALKPLIAQTHVRELLAGIAAHSPYVWRLARADGERLAKLLSEPPWHSLAACLARVAAAGRDGIDDSEMMRILRRAKQEVALLVALADLGGAWSVREVTLALTQFADAAVSAALSHLILATAAMHRGLVCDPLEPERDCGVVVLALGKQGAFELNYSSDIDLIVLYDAASPVIQVGVEPGPLFVGLTKRLVRLLQERTSDGYVLRVDLRLRPDPGSTAIAISLTSAFAYYEMFGQNWERAALIKARPIAGDRRLGARFLADLAPFIWRKYFDYAAIADIHAMKRQIHAFRGHEQVKVPGHDVKLGRGGIREIEFFVQTQQLIFGGRRPVLRGSSTLDMLVELQRDGWIDAKAVGELTAAYEFLRTIEHRLQMLNDEQTQRLPEADDALAGLAQFCGYRSPGRFVADLTQHLQRVESHYARLFEHAPELASAAGNLVFTGVTNDPETLATLRRLGLAKAEVAAETIRGWHFGRRPAVQTARSREVLTELVPFLLASFAESGNPDAALAAFDQALARMPAALELFSILKSNARVRQLFSDILGSAPRLAQSVVLRPHLLDAAIDPALLNPRTDAAIFDRQLQPLIQATGLEEFLDRIRDVTQEEMFLIGVRLLSGTFDPRLAGEAYSALAARVVHTTLAKVQQVFEADHGRLADAGCAIVALGKLGSFEMTASSDLDLVLLYDFDPDRPESSGPRSLHAVQYFTRLTQRLVSALTVPTRRGRLYDVDMRLRPSGGKGPVATQISSFVAYHRGEAETWEQMALTRARVIAGDATIAAAAQTAIRATIEVKRDGKRLQRDIVEMRDLIAQEKGDSDRFDLKLAAGGLIDIEFLAQYLVLNHAARYGERFDTRTDNILALARELGLLGEDAATRLLAAHRLFGDATQMMRVTCEGPFDPDRAGPAVCRQIARGCGFPDFPTLERELQAARHAVRRVFETQLDPA
jgi:glutamate-ammonia-ligase adenylyltransferase